MAQFMCIRCSRQYQYYWLIILAATVIFWHTYFYNIRADSHHNDRTDGTAVYHRQGNGRDNDATVVGKRIAIGPKKKFGKAISTGLYMGASTESVKASAGSRPVAEERNGDDKHKGGDDMPKGSDDMPKGSDDEHMDGGDKQKDSDDRHKGSDDRHKGSEDKHKGGDDKHKGGDDKHKGSDDKHKGSDDKHKGGDDKVTADHNAILKMREEINAINNDEVILNDNKFPPFELVIIVQVHRRTEYLKMLLESLREARDINTVLLVISLDYYNAELFSVVDKIDFCKVVKIFFPKSQQLYPNEFPSNSANDCPRDISREKAKEIKCTNADHPDDYGHYREAPVTAIKHHWWWKINHVFDGMKVTASYNGYVIFLEEDLYVAPDIIPVTKQLISMVDQQCKDCTLIGLGAAKRVEDLPNLQTFSNKVTIKAWFNNVAYAINRNTFNLIKNCSKQFCSFDDYNWDWTVYSLQGTCYRKAMEVITLESPRIYHIGTCGMHQRKHDGDDCNWNEAVVNVRSYISENGQFYFPAELYIESRNVPSTYPSIRNFGGWGDPRDHQMCLSFVHNK